MAGGQYLSSHQQKIVKRYYNQLDTIVINRLQGLVSDIAVNEDPKKTQQLWTRAQEALLKTPADPMRVARIVANRSTEQLAKLVADLAAGDKVLKDNPRPDPDAPANRAAATGTASGTPAAASPTTSSPTAAPAASPAASPVPASSGPDPKDPDVQKSALAAFRKRLKLMQLERDSKLSRSFLTGGKTTIAAIQAPNAFPAAVWNELVAAGKLKYDGSGLYRLP